MKKNTVLHLFGSAWVLALVTALALPLRTMGKDAEKQKSFTGTITALDAKDNSVKVHGYFFSKDFTLADNCKLAMSDKSETSLADFRRGQRVNVHYRDVDGVLVANKIAEEQLEFSGRVKMINPANRTLTVDQRGTGKTFDVADKCAVLQHGKSGDTLSNVKLGDRVTVIYEVPDNRLVAWKIKLPDTEHTAALTAIDLPDRTISIGKEQKFHLADDCVIIANGKMNGRMNDLRLGQNYDLTYRSVEGVNVVDRIAPANSASKAAATERTAQYVAPGL